MVSSHGQRRPQRQLIETRQRMFIYALGRAVQDGYLDQSYWETARKGWRVSNRRLLLTPTAVDIHDTVGRHDQVMEQYLKTKVREPSPWVRGAEAATKIRTSEAAEDWLLSPVVRPQKQLVSTCPEQEKQIINLWVESPEYLL